MLIKRVGTPWVQRSLPTIASGCRRLPSSSRIRTGIPLQTKAIRSDGRRRTTTTNGSDMGLFGILQPVLVVNGDADRMVPSGNTLDLLAGTRGWRSGTPIALTCGLCRRRPWSPRRNRLSRSARSAQSGRPPGFDTKWMALRVPAGVETSCVSAFTRVPRRDDQGSRTEYCARDLA